MSYPMGANGTKTPGMIVTGFVIFMFPIIGGEGRDAHYYTHSNMNVCSFSILREECKLKTN